MTRANTVRPTKMCLDELNISVPDLSQRLTSIEHPLILKAQTIPGHAADRSAERIVSVTDRVWFKVKTSNWRGAVGDLSIWVADIAATHGARWWLAAAGTRQADTSQSDFYARLKRAAFSGGPNTCSTDFMLPTQWDRDRLIAESAMSARELMRELVLVSAALSLRNSKIQGFTIGDRDVRVRIHVHKDGEAYIVIGATGSLDSTFFVALVSTIPGVNPEDWMPEPTGSLPIDLAPGEVVWSTMLPVETQQLLLDIDVSAYL